MSIESSGAMSPVVAVDSAGLAHVSFDDPGRSANVLTEAVMRRFRQIIDELQVGAETGEIRGILLSSGKPDSFIVGADVDAIAAVESPVEGEEGSRFGQSTFLALERLPVPTVAAIHGTCLGGGLELALACTARVASDHPDTKLGFPEVRLGILPAWGGTSRVPRLASLQTALDLILSGRSVSARSAARMGLVNDILPHGGFLRSARNLLEAYALGEVRPRARRRPLRSRLLEGNPIGRRIVFAMAARRVAEESQGHYPAPPRILEVIRASWGQSFEDALELEAAAAGELLVTSVSANLIHVFRMHERARKGSRIAGLADARQVTDLGVVGAGVMGGGIAQLAAYHEIRVRLRDLRTEPLAQALDHAQGLMRKAVDRKKLTRRQAVQAMDRISSTTNSSGFRPVDFVVEAVVEKLEVKRSVLRELEERVTRECVLATNTSSLSVDAMAEGMRHPERLLGLHFFNPVHRMPLVEIVRGHATGDAAVAVAYALALRLGKVPVVVQDGPGFLVNRILGPYLNEAGFLLAEGASIEKIDDVALKFGMPMGPLRLIDEIGIDVMRHAGEILHEAFGARLTPAPPLEALGESGRLGRKGGEGLYRFVEGEAKGVDPSAYAAMGLPTPVEEGSPDPEEIRDRLVLAMINEAALALSDEIVATAGDVDLAMIMGTGFPPFHGGLLRLADARHPKALVERLGRLEKSVAPRFSPASLLLELAREDRGFYDAFPDEG